MVWPDVKEPPDIPDEYVWKIGERISARDRAAN
jgi:hypothetical protein